MRVVRRLTVIVLLVFASGCGGSESTAPVDTTTGSSARAATPTKKKGDFRGPQARFGHESSTAERAQASQMVQGWLRARAATDWAADCSYFSRRYRHVLVAEDAASVSNGEVKNCPQALAFFGIAASGDYQNTLSGSIDSFRVGGTQGIALYHGTDGNDWAVPMEKEGGKWWIAISLPSELE